MRKKQTDFEILENIEIIDIASEGKSVAKVDDLVIFVEKAVPGDIADIQLYKKKKNFAEGRAIRIVKPSSKRVEVFCEHFGICGGCKWQNLAYEHQIAYKQNQVQNAMERLAKVTIPEIQTILGSEQIRFYRNKMEYTFSNKRWLLDDEQGVESLETNALGFHVPRRFDKIIDINRCHLQDDFANTIRNYVREYALKNKLDFFDIKAQKGFLRNLIIRNTSIGEWMLVVVFAAHHQEQIDTIMSTLANEFPSIQSLLYVINQKRNDTIYDQDIITFRGKDHIVEEMINLQQERLKFRISPKAFYQTNSAQAERLYHIAAELADLKGHELVYDLYTGTGTIANFIAGSASKVIGIEYIPEAIEDAKINSELNNIHNTVFYSGDMKDIFSEEFIHTNGKPDVIITDPPRSGMHEDVCKQLLNLKAEKIVYISCNPATQARDLTLLDEAYEVTYIQPVDMFPHTEHVENIVLLRLKK